VGTINPVREIVARAHAVGALTFLDAVHYVPHGPVDAVALGTDLLVTSVYKWFGPHLGVLYGRGDLLASLPTYKVRPAHDRVETGTQNFEGIAGTLAAVDYLRSVGRRFGGSGAGSPDGSERRREIVAAMRAIGIYERGLAQRLISGLSAIAGLRIWGVADPGRLDERTPTLAVTLDGVSPREAADALGRQGIFAWDGDFYAQGLIERLGLFGSGGVLRLGIVHYNTEAEVDRLLEALERIAAGHVASALRG
jgi:selenocysteine lyase/cysteine desulfurase